MMETVKERSEVSEEFKWAVTDIYKNDDCWNDDYNAVKAMTEKLASFRGRLSESAETMLEYFKLNDDLGIKLDSLVNYAHRRRDEDNRNSVYQEMCGRLSALISDIAEAGAFEVPEILSIDENVLEGFFEKNKDLGLCRTDAGSTGYYLFSIL